MQNLPDQTREPVGDRADGLSVSHLAISFGPAVTDRASSASVNPPARRAPSDPIRHRGEQFGEPKAPEMYVPFAQSPGPQAMLAVRTTTGPELLRSSLAAAGEHR